MTAPTSLTTKLRDLVAQSLDLGSQYLDLLSKRLDETDVTSERDPHLSEATARHFREAINSSSERIKQLNLSLDRISLAVRKGALRGLYPSLTKAAERLGAGLPLEPDLVNKVIVELQRSLHSSVAVAPEGTSAPGSASADPGQSGGAA